jgi:hypothetical protein
VINSASAGDVKAGASPGLSNAGDDAVLVQVGQITAAALRKPTQSGRRTAHPWISRPAKLLSRLRIDMA